jgi:hypothetical protein
MVESGVSGGITDEGGEDSQKQSSSPQKLWYYSGPCDAQVDIRI